MNENPLVSIVIPVYNGSNYLREAIDSALAQTYSNFEVIVVNDGSDDNGKTEEIALSYGDKIRYFYKENGGVATALNLAIKNMKGEYFSWLSHDDLYYSNKLEVQIEALKKCGDMTRIVISDYDFLEQERQEISNFRLTDMASIEKIENSIFTVLQCMVGGCTLLIHKSHFERVGNFNETLITTQDYDLWFRMFRYQKLLYVPKSLIISRLHKEQGTHTISCVSKEREELHLGFVNLVSNEEIIAMYGSKANFYSKMLNFFEGNGMKTAFLETNKKFQETSIPNNFSEQIGQMKEFLAGISNNKTKKICIFGAGYWGIKLYYELKNKLVNVDYFCDNNPTKYGYLVDNRECIPFDELKKIKNDVLVIIAIKSAIDIITKQLKDNGFKFVLTKQELEKRFFDVSELKWMSSLDGIENIDYSSPEIQTLINKFKDTIFDVCSYYEGRK